MRFLALITALAACSKADPPAPKPELRPPPSVRFGDCAGPDTTWISGPAPAPFDGALAAARGKVPVTTYDTLPISIESTRWEGVVPQIRVPRAEASNTDYYMPAGDDVDMLALRFRPKGAYARFLGSEPLYRDLESFISTRGELFAPCFAGGERPGFSQPVTVHYTLTPHGNRSSVDNIVTDGITGDASACVKKILRTYRVDSVPDSPVNVVARFEIRRDPDRPPPPATIDHLFDPARRRGTDSSYKPSARNPLVAAAPAIASCLAASNAPYGAVVVDLAKHAAHGVDGPTATCIAKATFSISSDRRCSLAYGEMPAADLPTIEVAEAPAAIDLAARQAKLRGGAPVVAIYGVNVIRAKDDTPMKHVARELSRVLLANEDFVLARATKTGWELFDPPTEKFPIVPVPVGTGAFWNRMASSGQPGEECECVYWSLFSTKTAVWISVSRTNDHIEIKRDAAFATTLAKELDRMKHTAFLIDRTDVEIAATDDSTYGALLDLITAARAAGFTDWQLWPANTVHTAPDLP